jgi:hypothetical protein
MARRGRQNDEIKRLVEARQSSAGAGVATPNTGVPQVLYTFVLAPIYSSHQSLTTFGANATLLFTPPRSAYYRIRVEGVVRTYFATTALLGAYSGVSFTLAENLTPSATFPTGAYLADFPLTGLYFKYTPVGQEARHVAAVSSEVFCFLNAGQACSILATKIGELFDNDTYIESLRVYVEFLTDSRRTGSY